MRFLVWHYAVLGEILGQIRTLPVKVRWGTEVPTRWFPGGQYSGMLCPDGDPGFISRRSSPTQSGAPPCELFCRKAQGVNQSRIWPWIWNLFYFHETSEARAELLLPDSTVLDQMTSSSINQEGHPFSILAANDMLHEGVKSNPWYRAFTVNLKYTYSWKQHPHFKYSLYKGMLSFPSENILQFPVEIWGLIQSFWRNSSFNIRGLSP